MAEMFPGTKLDRLDVEHCDECIHAVEDCTCVCTECGKSRNDCGCDNHIEPRPWVPPYMGGWHYKSKEEN